MKYWVMMCIAVGLTLGDECIGWICLLLAVVPPLLRFAFRWSAMMHRENARYTGGIDSEGFYY